MYMPHGHHDEPGSVYGTRGTVERVPRWVPGRVYRVGNRGAIPVPTQLPGEDP